MGIKVALSLTKNYKGHITIFTDSLSTLKAIHNASSTSAAVILQITTQLETTTQPIDLVWTPGHVGIPINEMADIFSRRTTMDGSILRALDQRDAMASTLSSQRQAILQNWHTIASNRALKHLRRFQYWPSDGSSSRELEVLLYRLRTNTAPLNVFKYTRKLYPTPACPHCGNLETSFHYWIECPAYLRERTNLGVALGVDITSLQDLDAIYWPRPQADPRRHIAQLERYIVTTRRFT